MEASRRDAGAELRASLDSFVKGLKGTAHTQRRFSFKAARGAMLPALDFTYAAANSGGAGRIVVDGKRTYMWVTVVRTGHNASAETARHLNSIAITAAARR